jgi:hypothetical protein
MRRVDVQEDETGEDIPAAAAPQGGAAPGTDGRQDNPRPRPAGWRGRVSWGASLAGAAIIATGAGFGIASLAAGPGGPAPVSSAIPSPATRPAAFQEDDNLTGQDNQDNIVQETAPGMVHIMDGRTSEGTGMVLTPSGKVLTTYQPAPGVRDLAAKYVLSGTAFRAQVIGEADGLTLLQLEGGDGRAFSTVTVGNSATVVDGSYDSQEVSYHITGEVLDTAVGSSGTSPNVAIDLGTLVSLNATVAASGHTRSGLMESVFQSAPSTELGGPVVDLNGHVIGITVAEAGSGLNVDGYAIPINSALAIAAQIDARVHDS